MTRSSDRPRGWRRYALWSGAGALALTAVLAVLYFTVFTMAVNINGHSVRVGSGASVGDLFAKGLITGRSGDLVSAGTANVLKAGGGLSRYAVVNGRTDAPGNRLRNGDVIVSHNGTNTVEPILERTELLPFDVSYVGQGPAETIAKKGQPGSRLVRYGALSNEVATRKVVKVSVAEVIRRGAPAPGAKLIALTFDDGPWPGQTAAILHILQSNHVLATFFEIGGQARRHPDLSRMVTRAGMLIGNHTESHPLHMDRLPAGTVVGQISQAESDIAKASGAKPRYFRPPGGNTAPAMFPVLTRLGMKWAEWDVDTNDWKRPPASSMADRAMSGARPGAVILMHDGGGDRSQTIAALPIIIRKLKAQGYVFVTLDGLPRLPHTMG